MKIALFTDTYFPQINGVSFVVRNHAKKLIERGHEVEIFAPKSKEPYELDNEIPTHRFKSIRFRPYPDYDIAFPWIPKIQSYISQGNFDIIHCHTPFSMGLSGLFIAKSLNAKKRISSKLNRIRKRSPEFKRIALVGTFHTVISDFGHVLKPVPERLTGKVAEKFGTKFYNRMDLVITPSEHTRGLLKKYGVEKPIHVLSNGIDRDLFKPDRKGAEILRKNYKINNNPLILHVGRISEERNVDEFVRSVPLILNKIPGAKFLVVGGGPSLEKLKELASDLNLNNIIIFTGRVEQHELISSYTAADIFVTPSTIDTQGLVVLESFACETPVVAAGAKALPEIVIENETGFLFEPHNVKHLSERAIELLANPQLREKMAKNGSEMVKRHDIEKSVDKIIEIYESSLNRN